MTAPLLAKLAFLFYCFFVSRLKYQSKTSLATGTAVELPSPPCSIKIVITIFGLSYGAKPVNQA